MLVEQRPVISAIGARRCNGNYGGQEIQSGVQDDILPYLKGLDADFLPLAFARRRSVQGIVKQQGNWHRVNRATRRRNDFY